MIKKTFGDNVTLYNADCLDVMREMEAGSVELMPIFFLAHLCLIYLQSTLLLNGNFYTMLLGFQLNDLGYTYKE